jgi:hypothetical protein
MRHGLLLAGLACAVLLVSAALAQDLKPKRRQGTQGARQNSGGDGSITQMAGPPGFSIAHPEEVSAVAEACAVFVALLSMVLTVWTLWLQRRHNFLSVMPIASLQIGDYEDCISVDVGNGGVGPLIVDSFVVSDSEAEKDDVISWMPVLPEGLYWATFRDGIDGLCIPVGERVHMLRLRGDTTSEVFRQARDEVRRALSALTITLTYRDVYGRKMPPITRDLSWFGRRLSEASAEDPAASQTQITLARRANA